MRQVFIGYDPRETLAYRVCIASMIAHSGNGVSIQPVNARLLGTMYQRAEEKRGRQLWDVVSNAPMSTEFANARFFIQFLAGRKAGWVLFCDCDFLWRGSIQELFALADDSYAVMVVKHRQEPTELVKMDGQRQTAYACKNWSSLMLWNCGHPANESLTLDKANGLPGRDLHRFCWLQPELVGELPPRWNWLSGVSPQTEPPKAVHFTLGTPDMKGYENSPYASEWRAYDRSRSH